MLLSVVSALVLFFYCYYSNAELLEEGTTVTKEIISSDGEITEIEETTTTITNYSKDFVDSATTDVGGIGSIYSHSATCTAGFPDGRASPNCGRARNNSLTTWDRTISINEIIENGGKIDYEFYFAFPNNMYQNDNLTAYTQIKGYDGNTLVFDTGQILIDKSDFTQNTYTTTTNWVDYVTGSYDYSGSLTKIWTRMAGTGEYWWDEFQHTVWWNEIDVSVQTYFEIIQPQIIATDMNTIDTINIIPQVEEIPIQDIVEDFGMDNFTTVEIETVDVLEEIAVIEEMPEINVAAVEEIQQLDVEPEILEPETTLESTEDSVVIDEPTNDTNVEPEVTENDIADNEPINEEKSVDEPKEVAENKNAEKNQESQKQEPKEQEQKKVLKTKQKTVAEKKTEKAKQIMSTFNDIYSAEAQNTQLLLIMALGTDLTQSKNNTLPPQVNLQEYIHIEEKVIMDDLYGDYLSVGSSLKYQAMVDSQYE